MQHSVLGTRWVDDGLRDPRLVIMLAAVTMTGPGRGARHGRLRRTLVHRASNVGIHGGGWTQERVPVDGFELDTEGATESVLGNDRFVLTVYRWPGGGPRPTMGLTATWDGQSDPVVLAKVERRAG